MEQLPFLYLPNQLPIFGLGIILYFVVYSVDAIKFSFKFIFIISVCVIVCLAIKPELFVFDAFYFGIAFLLLTFALHRYHPLILFNPLFRYIGKISYTLYLTHFAAIFFLSKEKLANVIKGDDEITAIINYALNYGMVLIISVFISTILYHVIEEPMQRFGKRLIRN